jgi:hypothetical protein
MTYLYTLTAGVIEQNFKKKINPMIIKVGTFFDKKNLNNVQT